MTTKHKPATPLPHHVHAETLVYSDRADENVASFKLKRDAVYYTCAANAYPRLVALAKVAMQDCVDVSNRALAKRLLRELGETDG